jgi:protein AATF/BFR2
MGNKQKKLILAGDDPENWDFTVGGDYSMQRAEDDSASDLSSDNEDEQMTGREHYVDVGRSVLRSQQFELEDQEGKYGGQTVSRRDAIDSNDFDDGDDDDDDFSQDFTDGDFSSSSGNESSSDDQGYSDNDSQSNDNHKQSRLQQQIEELAQEEK